MSEPPLPQKVVAIDERLADAHIPHAFGGALALAYYAEPRATIDIDVNVFVAPEEQRLVDQALVPLGIGDAADASVVERDGQVRVWWGRTPVDLFFEYDDLHRAMRRSVRRVPFADTRIPILSPEHLIVCELVFDRPKDWIDIEQMLVGLDRIDVGEVRAHSRRLAGADDPRLARFEELALRLRGV